jgi:hypothetical protein
VTSAQHAHDGRFRRNLAVRIENVVACLQRKGPSVSKRRALPFKRWPVFFEMMRSSFEKHGRSFSKQPVTIENDAAVVSIQTVDCSQSTSVHFDAIKESHQRHARSFQEQRLSFRKRSRSLDCDRGHISL